MNKILSIVFACFLVTVTYAQETKVKAIIERYDASFTMSSQSVGTFKVNKRVRVLDKDATGMAVLAVYSDNFRTLSSFSGFLESGGKVVKKYKMSDLENVSVGEGITDASAYCIDPVAPVPYVVEYTYEVSYKNGFISFPSFVPVTSSDVVLESASYVLSVPPGTELMYKSNMEPMKESGAKSDIYKWTSPHFSGYVYEHMMPSIFEQVPYLYVAPESFTYARTQGAQTDWQAAGLWLYGLQKEACTTPDALRTKVEQLISGVSDHRQKIKILYDYLRQTTRYVSIQLGIGGLKPFPVDMVMNSGFGDCKALSVYMQSLLTAAGIHSEYLILDTGRKNLIKDFYSVGQMNHAMLCVPMQKDTLWIECTNPRYPLGYRHDDIAGHEVVLIGENGGKRVRVRAYPDSLRKSVEKVEVVLNADGTAHCVGSRHVVLDQAESYIGFESRTEKQKFNSIMGANSLTPTNFKILSIEDNFDAWANMPVGEEYVPECTISYEFDAANYAKVSGDRIFINMNPFAVSMHADRKQRINDFVRSRRNVMEDIVELTIPQGYVVESIPNTSEIVNPFGTFHTQVAQVDGKISIIQTLTLVPGRYPKEEYEQYRAFAKEVTKAYSARIVLRKE